MWVDKCRKLRTPFFLSLTWVRYFYLIHLDACLSVSSKCTKTFDKNWRERWIHWQSSRNNLFYFWKLVKAYLRAQKRKRLEPPEKRGSYLVLIISRLPCLRQIDDTLSMAKYSQTSNIQQFSVFGNIAKEPPRTHLGEKAFFLHASISPNEIKNCKFKG